MTPEEEEAATRIQAIQRGRQARKEVKSRQDDGPVSSPRVHGGVMPDGTVLNEGIGSPRAPDVVPGALTQDMIVSGLRCLGLTEDATSLVYLKCDLGNLRLKNIDAIAKYSRLRELDLTNNLLENLAAVDGLPDLCTLLAPRNRLRKVLESAPHTRTLQTLDLSRNLITHIPDLSRLRVLRAVHLDHNQIREISGVERLESLTELSLVGNRLGSLTGLSGPPIRRLRVRDNAISDATGLFDLGSTVEEVDVAGNEVSTLAGFKQLTRLRSLDVGSNHLGSVEELQELRSLEFLRELTLAGNPMAQQCTGADDGGGSDAASDVVRSDDDDATPPDAMQQPVPLPLGVSLPGGSTLGVLLSDHVLGPALVTNTDQLGKAALFRYGVLFAVPQLTLLDGDEVTGAEKTKARNVLGGADQASRVGHEQEYFQRTVTVLRDTGSAAP